MTKIDVAINSYKKPESLIYTLMTLKKVAADLIDTVYINDDCSDNGAYELYTHPAVAEYFKPWKLDVRVNTHTGNAFIHPHIPITAKISAISMPWTIRIKII